MNKFFRFAPAPGRKLWDSVFEVRDEARQDVLGVLKNTVIALMELGKFQDVNKAIAYVHDKYYTGKFWDGYDFTVEIFVIPGKITYVMLRNGGNMGFQHYEGLQGRPGFVSISRDKQHGLMYNSLGEYAWRDRSVELPVCNRSNISDLFEIVAKELQDFKQNHVKGPNYRAVKQLVQEIEGCSDD